MYQFIPPHSFDYLNKISIKINVMTDRGIAEKKLDTEQKIKLKWRYKGGYECEFKSWSDSSVG